MEVFSSLIFYFFQFALVSLNYISYPVEFNNSRISAFICFSRFSLVYSSVFIILSLYFIIMSRFIVYSLLVFSCILVFFSFTAYSDCGVFVRDNSGDPIENMAVFFRSFDSNSSIFNSTTDSSGYVLYSGDCGNLYIEFNYPSSQYATNLSGAYVNPVVHINDWVTARIQLLSSSGSGIEGQDCSVVIYDNNSVLIYDYKSLCQKNEPFLDDAGNWAVFSGCRFSDSGGWYFFKGRVDESMGFEYDQVYDLVFTCNAVSSTVSFNTSFEKTPLDMAKTENFIRNYSGLLVVVFPVGLLLILLGVVVILILYNLRFRRRRVKK